MSATTSLVPLPNTLTIPLEKLEQIASEMAREFQEATQEITDHILAIKVQTDRLQKVFQAEQSVYRSDFEISYEYSGVRHYRGNESNRIITEMRRRAWRILVDKLGIKNVMSIKRRREFEDQLERGELPEITSAAIMGLVSGLYEQSHDFAAEASREVFEILRPQRGGYKTNDKFRVGRKVILDGYVERCWNGKQYRVHYYHEQHLIAIDGIFHLLDGKGIMREHRGPLVTAIQESPDGRGETELFRFKCFKNRNLHLEIRREDLIRRLNLLAAGEDVLGCDMTD